MSALLEIDGLTVDFVTRSGKARVVDGLSFAVGPGETVCIVGESGCGKSMSALAIMGLLPGGGTVARGRVLYHGEDLVAAGPARLRELRGDRMAMIFQEPMSSLNPLFPVGEQIAEVARAHLGLGRPAALARAIEMMGVVHIPEPERRAGDYPHQFSGGMRQRVMIAMGLVCEPELIIADEPTTALDVTVQAQIFELLKELSASKGMALILITHDLGAVAEVAERVVVMYAGRKVEEGGVRDVLGEPAHPYARGLLACRPRIGRVVDGIRTPLPEIPGMVPAPGRLGAGCHFAPRCPQAMPRCTNEVPPAFDVRPGQRAACWLLEAGGVRR